MNAEQRIEFRKEQMRRSRSVHAYLLPEPSTPLDLCQRIQAAAIECDDYHVFVQYAPHVSGLSVYVERTDTAYHDPDRVLDRIIDEMVYIDMPDAMQKLTDIVDQLQRLGVDV